MTKPIPAEQFQAMTQAAPPAAPHRGEYGRAFDLHPALFALTVGGYFAFLAVMGLAFMEPGLAIPMAIFALFVVAGFGTPALWARIAPPPAGEAPSWGRFLEEGFECMTGHVSARSAMAQVLIMPALILFWGIAVAIIAALLR